MSYNLNEPNGSERNFKKKYKKKNSVHQAVFRVLLVAGEKYFFVHCLSAEDGFGLFAILRAYTQNDAMFDPDFCGVLILSVAVCFFQLFFSHDYDFPSPQNRFKGPKVVRLKSLATSRSERKNSVTRKGN